MVKSRSDFLVFMVLKSHEKVLKFAYVIWVGTLFFEITIFHWSQPLFVRHCLYLRRWQLATVCALASGRTRSWRSVLLLSRCCWCWATVWRRRRQLNLHWKHPPTVLLAPRLHQQLVHQQPAAINTSRLPSGTQVQVGILMCLKLETVDKRYWTVLQKVLNWFIELHTHTQILMLPAHNIG